MYKRVTVPLKADEYERLERLAEQHDRLPEQQIKHWVRQALQQQPERAESAAQGSKHDD